MDDSALVRIAKAIADPTRFAILKAIAAHEEVSCGKVAEMFPIAQATVSHHLNMLVNAGLVEMRKQGQHHYFRLRKEAVQIFGEQLLRSLAGEPSAPQAVTAREAREDIHLVEGGG
ncbi:MAG: ArsR/SmtB family transcription factor [Armatimonadota bacterium]